MESSYAKCEFGMFKYDFYTSYLVCQMHKILCGQVKQKDGVESYIQKCLEVTVEHTDNSTGTLPCEMCDYGLSCVVILCTLWTAIFHPKPLYIPIRPFISITSIDFALCKHFFRFLKYMCCEHSSQLAKVK